MTKTKDGWMDCSKRWIDGFLLPRNKRETKQSIEIQVPILSRECVNVSGCEGM